MKQLMALAAFLGLCYGAAGLGSIFTRAGVGTWYDQLRKPIWTPAGSLIGGVWSVLYTLMSISAYLAWRHGWSDARVRTSLTWFGIQLGLNTAWSIIFFGLRLPGVAAAELALLWAAIARWLTATVRVDWRAALLIVPYFGWVTFAGVLNFTIWRMNH